MGDEPPTDTVGSNKRKASSTPPDGYVCRLCSQSGHWIQICPTKKTGTKNNSEGTKRRRKASDHVPVPGQDPSPEDIEEAKELQKIPPPKCFCGLPSRLNKVKRSREGGEHSRAVGKYFFFCSKQREDETQCRFARPLDLELSKRKNDESGDKRTKEKSYNAKSVGRKKTEKKTTQVCKFFANGSCTKGSKCEFLHDQPSGNAMNSVKKEKQPTQICKFFAKSGSCKKGRKCEFSHQQPIGNFAC